MQYGRPSERLYVLCHHSGDLDVHAVCVRFGLNTPSVLPALPHNISEPLAGQ